MITFIITQLEACGELQRLRIMRPISPEFLPQGDSTLTLPPDAPTGRSLLSSQYSGGEELQ